MVTNSWHILSHQQHFPCAYTLPHHYYRCEKPAGFKALHWCVCTQAWVRCVHSTSWYGMCTQLFSVTFWLTRKVHYSTVGETSCSIWNAYIKKFLQKCSIRWQDNYCNPCTCLCQSYVNDLQEPVHTLIIWGRTIFCYFC